MAAQDQDPMEFIWERIPKTKEGLVHYLPGDIPYLYFNGFVDSNTFSFEDWAKAFEDCKQSDDSYLVTKEKFLSLRHYRYVGPVWSPFDPYKIREGEWTDAQLERVFERSIQPSSTITKEIFLNNVKALKKQGFVKNNNLLVNDKTKKQLAYLLDRFPSPRRKLEIEVARLRKERESQYRETTQKRDTSKFTSGKLESESNLEKFKKLESKTLEKKPTPQKEKTKPQKEIDIKKLRKPSRTIKG